MALGDGIRRNIAHVEPSERALLRDALKAINAKKFPGSRTDAVPGGVSWWFKQDETHAATHVHGGPEFVPWHREIVNRLEGLVREINPKLSLHYWDWTQNPNAVPGANLGGGSTGTLDLLTSGFFGYGGSTSAPIGEPWLGAGYYVPGASPNRDTSGNPADPPTTVVRSVGGSPASVSGDNAVVDAANFPAMRGLLEGVHNAMHGFVNMGGAHVSFRDPFVFLLHSNMDRLYARWQTQPGHSERLKASTIYGSESGDAGLNGNVEPWSGGASTRPWSAPDSWGVPHNYKHHSLIVPPKYDTNASSPRSVRLTASLYSGSKCYFFAGNRYIRVTRGDTGPGTVDPGYPAPISSWGWGSFGARGIDAALYSGSKCYFFAGDKYIRVTRGDTGPGTVDPGYPAPISNWGWGSFGARGIDASLYSGSKCYFFAGNRYVRVTRGDTGPGTVDPGYPAPVDPNWGWPGSFDERWLLLSMALR